MDTDDLGTAAIRPRGSFPVGQRGTWEITYTAGRYGMDDGGSFLIVQRDMTDGGRLQCDSPREEGFVSASTNGEARVDVGYHPWGWVRPWRGALRVRVYDGSLRPGDRVTVRLGDASMGSAGWDLQTFPEAVHEFRVLVDPFGTGLYRAISTHPSIRIVPSNPASLDAVLPSRAAPGEGVPLWIRVLDRWGNPVDPFQGDVHVTCEPSVQRLPHRFRAMHGVSMVGPIRFPGPGVYRLHLASQGLFGQSNPIEITDQVHPLFWADLHGQTQDGIGTGSVEEYFTYARDRALVQACSWQGNDFQVSDGSWSEVCGNTRKFDEPGRFVTFLGYEWSGPTPLGGDHNIMFLGDDQPIRRSSAWQIDGSGRRAWVPLSDLWRRFGNRKDVMAVAHVGGRHANLDFWDPKFCSLIEVHSNHGTFEWLVEEALRRGYLFGVVGGSDDHSGRPGWSPPLRRGGVRGTVRLDSFGGLTSIYADEFTRPGLWRALRSRHCYATTGRRIILDVRSDDWMMGDVVQSDRRPKISVKAIGTAPLLDVKVMREDGRIFPQTPGAELTQEWVRVDWSGLRIKSRDARAVWDGTIRVVGGKIGEFVSMGFWREGDGIRSASRNELTIKSATSGDMAGVFLRVSGRAPSIRFQSPLITREIRVSRLKRLPVEFGAGGVNLRLGFSLCSPEGRPNSVDLEFTDSRGDGDHAYWVKVLQMDGHSAWSSPIFFRRTRRSC